MTVVKGGSNGEAVTPNNSGQSPATFKRVRLKDVAILANVDVSTVSRVLNDDLQVKPETRDRIFAATKKLGYQPDATARALRTGRTGTLGMLVPDFANPVYSNIIRGAVRRAEELDLVMVVAELRDDDPDLKYGRLVSEARIDGLVIASARDSSRLIDELRDSPVPYLFVNRRVEGSSRSIVVDDKAAAALAAEALIAAGHQELGMIAGPDDVETSRRRRSGFAMACNKAGLPTPTYVAAPYTMPGGYHATLQLLNSGKSITAIFASSLLSGLGCLAALRTLQLNVPSDISLITYDGEAVAFSNPPLTAVSVPLDELGAKAVDEMNRLLHGETPRDLLIRTAPQLVIRESVASPSSR